VLAEGNPLRRVESGAQVFNLLGSTSPATTFPGAAMREALAAARHVTLWSSPSRPAATRAARALSWPFPTCISVGAFRLDASNGYAVTGYSGFGEALDLVGPGGVSDQDVITTASGMASGAGLPPGRARHRSSWWLFAGTSGRATGSRQRRGGCPIATSRPAVGPAALAAKRREADRRQHPNRWNARTGGSGDRG